MKGLDDFITGRFDPNNPANQVDWTEIFGDTLGKCDWVTEGMLDDDETHLTLGNLMFIVHDKLVDHNKYYSSKEKYQFNKDNAEKLAALLKEQWDFVSQVEGKLVVVKSCPIDKKYIPATSMALDGQTVAKVKNGRVFFDTKSLTSYELTTDWKLELIDLDV